MRSRISGIGVEGGKTRVWVRIGNDTQRNYNRFVQSLVEELSAEKRGYHGYTEVRGRGFEIDVFKGSEYLHLVIRSSGKIGSRVREILAKYFELRRQAR